MNTRNISFSEKKVSKNAVITLVMGIIILIGFVILTILSVVTGGGLNVIGGLIGCILMILAFFCVLWGVMRKLARNTKYQESALILWRFLLELHLL